MKKRILVLASLMLAGIITVNAQDAPPQRRTVEERVKMTMEKLEPLKLDEAKKTEVDSIFARAFRAQDVKRAEMRASGSTDRDAMRAEMQKMSADMDDKLKKVLTDEQFKEWKEKIQPSLRPQRPGGGGNGN
ncbi:MAG: hypothetical protein H7Y42_06240 [Chitinophagaceae bacterium]|nr:hypothetical protein [Chitinophagaceae bacterium]